MPPRFIEPTTCSMRKGRRLRLCCRGAPQDGFEGIQHRRPVEPSGGGAGAGGEPRPQPGSTRILRTAAAMAGALAGGTSSASRPSVARYGMPPTSVETTHAPQAMASTTRDRHVVDVGRVQVDVALVRSSGPFRFSARGPGRAGASPTPSRRAASRVRSRLPSPLSGPTMSSSIRGTPAPASPMPPRPAAGYRPRGMPAATPAAAAAGARCRNG